MLSQLGVCGCSMLPIFSGQNGNPGHSITMGNDGVLWAADQGSHKLLGYDANGNFLYSWGTFGTCQGCQWGVHGFATDKEGNLYTSEVRTGRVQKYAPRKGANPAFLVGKPWPSVW